MPVPRIIEVACNLLPSAPTLESVKALVAGAAAPLGLRVVRDYSTGLVPEEVIARSAL
jgi:hypothetical protein